MKLPFIILSRTTWEKTNEHIVNLQNEIQSLKLQAITRNEENKNLRYNYEDIKSQIHELGHRFNQLLHKYNVLNKKFNNVTSKHPTSSSEVC